MRSFRHFAPAARTFHGSDCLAALASEARRVGSTRALVFCGRTLARAPEGLAAVQAALGDLYAGAFTEVVEQSPLPVVERAVAALRDARADAVIVLGGGSAVVTARAAAILLAEAKPAEALATVFAPGAPPRSPRLTAPKLPQLIVATTPTTAYAKNGAAVTLPGEGRRLALFDPKARAQALFVSPEVIRATPARLIVDAGLDAFAQGIQGLESSKSDPLADARLIQGVRLIHRSLAAARDADADDARSRLMLAAQLIGEGTDVTGAGAASALGHAIGARFPVGNGAVKAVVLPHTLRFNAPATAARLDPLGDALGLDGAVTAERVADACARLFATLGLPTRLRDLGVPHEALGEIAADAAADWFLTQNPQPVSDAALTDLLEVAW